MTTTLSSASDRKPVWRDPLGSSDYGRLMSADGRAALRTSKLLHACSGILEGAALLTLLPISMSLASGESSWGLGTVGWICVLAVLAVITAVVRFRESIIGYRAALDMLTSVYGAIGNHLAGLPLGWFGGDRAGMLSRLVSNGVMAIGQSVAHMYPQVVSNAAAMLTILVGSWLWDPRIGLTLTVAAPVAFGIMIVAQRVRRFAAARTTPTEELLANRIVEYAQCQPALRSAGCSQRFAPLKEAVAANGAALRRELWVSLLPIVANGIVVQLVVVAMITVAGNLAVDGALAPLTAVAFVGLVLRFSRNISDMGAMILGIEEFRPPLNDITEILDTPTLPVPARPSEPKTPGQIEFKNVTFGYDPTQPVIRDLSFTVHPGTMTALVGPSGSGKTTVARLISRFWEVSSGSIEVGGTDVRDMTVEVLMAQLSMVFQDVYLFDDTLEANVRVGRDNATDAEVRRAADLAGVTEIAARLPNGWETRVGEGGRSLSGGERQRVSVARALLKQAPIVLFDEATSALDAENESNIVASVDQLRRSSTFVVIAHKLDTVRGADDIIVLDSAGGIAERGTHEELFQAHGAYRRFWDRREQATGWTLVPPHLPESAACRTSE